METILQFLGDFSTMATANGLLLRIPVTVLLVAYQCIFIKVMVKQGLTGDRRVWWQRPLVASALISIALLLTPWWGLGLLLFTISFSIFVVGLLSVLLYRWIDFKGFRNWFLG